MGVSQRVCFTLKVLKGRFNRGHEDKPSNWKVSTISDKNSCMFSMFSFMLFYVIWYPVPQPLIKKFVDTAIGCS